MVLGIGVFYVWLTVLRTPPFAHEPRGHPVNFTLKERQTLVSLLLQLVTDACPPFHSRFVFELSYWKTCVLAL